jgi:tetratricopeptide (TPR) repeat protein
MSLLSQDPRGRPASAAELMDRLGAIAKLPPAEDLRVADAYLATPAWVGRDRERKRIREHLRREVGFAEPIMIEGAEGMGKTRLLHELVLEAKLAGCLALQAQRPSTDVSYAVARQLVDDLLACAPESVNAITPQERALLAHAFPCFAPSDTARPPALAPAELRHRMQHALASWFARAAGAARLVIAVDDFHAADEESAGLLVAVAANSGAEHVCLAVAVRNAQLDETRAVRVLRRLATVLSLRKLSAPELLQLVDSVFGEVPNTGRVAHWLYERTKGNPLECMELLRYLIKRELLHYTEGTWMLPATFPRELPEGLAATRSARMLALQPAQRALADALAIFGSPVSLALCAQLAELDDGSARRAADALLVLELLTTQGDEYMFRSDAQRDAVTQALAPERARTLHERAGQLLLAGRNALDLRTRVRAAEHLMRGSSQRQGADVIAEIARDPRVPRDIGEFLVAPLELALAIYERERLAPAHTIPLRMRLVIAAFLHDRNLVRYGVPLLAQLQRDAGLDRVEERDYEQADWFERMSARAAERYAQLSDAARGLSPSEALTTLGNVCSLVLAGGILKYDIGLIQQVWHCVKPLAMLGSNSGWSAAPELVGLALKGLTVGEASSHEERVAYLARLADPSQYSGFPEARRQSIAATQFHNIGMASSMLDGQSALQLADRIDAFGLQMYEGAALQVRLMVHMYRGNAEEAAHCRARLDVLALQGGAGAQFELWLAPYLADPYALWDDVIGLKRAAAHLKRLAASDAGYAPMALIATGHYCRVRGDHAKALDAFRRACALAPRDEHASWLHAVCGMIEALVADGQYEAAMTAGHALLNTLAYGPRFTAVVHHRVSVGLALAEAHAGRVAQAKQRCGGAIADELALGGSPMCLGRLHEALARIALLEQDSAAFGAQLQLVQQHFSATHNPVLIKRGERLGEEGAARFSVKLDLTLNDMQLSRTLESLRTVSDLKQRARAALDVILRELNTDSGLLFLKDGDELELVASTTQTEVPEGLSTLLSTSLHALARECDFTAATLSIGPIDGRGLERMTTHCGQQAFMHVPLGVSIGGRRKLVGMVAVPLPSPALSFPRPQLMEAVAQSLCDASQLRIITSVGVAP